MRARPGANSSATPRKAIGDESAYAQKKMLDQQGVLNPGLMPQKLADLNLLAPARTEVDDVLVERWNRVAEVWRDRADFRTAVLRYATASAHRDPASTGLWPEVVYPLIERARWHRRIRGRTEAIWDYLSGKILHVADAGVVLDRAIERVVPAPLVAELDESINFQDESPRLDDEGADPFAPAPDEADRLTASLTGSRVSLVELASEPAESQKAQNLVRLIDLNPLRFVQSELHDLWKEAASGASEPGPGQAGRQGRRPSPRPDRPLSTERNPLHPRTHRRTDRHRGHGQQTDRADHTHPPYPRLRFQGAFGHLALPRQQPRHRSPRLHEHRALRSLARPKESSA